LNLETTKIDTKQGVTYHFIREERSPDSPLMLLKQGNRLFFIPRDILQEMQEGEK
jgi:hypothetical protein